MEINEKIPRDYQKSGRKGLSIGKDTEKRTWNDMLQKGWVCSKWHNNVDLENNKLIMAKPGRFKRTSTGFPDFVSFQMFVDEKEVIGIEVKTNRKLSDLELKKCEWLIKNGIFNRILVAYRIKEKNRVKILYEDFRNQIKSNKEKK